MPDALTVSRDDDGRVTLAFRGPLDVESVGALWSRTTDGAGDAGTALRLDVTGVTSCDGAGVGLLVEADRAARAAGAETTIVGASGELAELLRMATLDVDAKGGVRREVGVVEQIGAATANGLGTIRDFVAFIGDLTVAAPVGFATLNRHRLREIVHSCTRIGADAVPVVSLLGAIVGFILAMQAMRALDRVGTVSLVPMVVGFATLREFGPLIAAIILAGRSGSAFAAELGTMKVTEELDAYTTMALDPMVVLVFPRVVAGVLVTPLLAIFSIGCGVVAGVLPLLPRGYAFNAYLEGVIESVALADLVQALVKATVFGFIVASIGCFHGLRTGRGADAVGASATHAVVAGIVVVLVADSIISTIFYNLGY